MTTTVYFECPKCLAENSTEFDIGEHFCDIDECGECHHKFTQDELVKLNGELEIQAIESASGAAEMYCSDR